MHPYLEGEEDAEEVIWRRVKEQFASPTREPLLFLLDVFCAALVVGCVAAAILVQPVLWVRDRVVRLLDPRVPPGSCLVRFS